jgi:hypothetical protein
MRDQLAETLSSDGRAQKLLQRVRGAVPDRSGEVQRGEAPSYDGEHSQTPSSKGRKAAG